MPQTRTDHQRVQDQCSATDSATESATESIECVHQQGGQPVASQGFSVDPTTLLEVADSVHQLHQDLAGVGSVAGSLEQYRTKAAATVLRAALESFWDGTDVFASAYDREQKGIVVTMQSMLTQLAALEKACRATAAQYGSHETASKKAVQHTEPGGWR